MCFCIAPQAYREVNRKARKEHKCCECRQVIAIGETYKYESGVWDGDPSSYKTCLSCVAVRDEFQREYECCIPFGMLMEEINEISINEFCSFDQLVAASECKDGLNKLFGEQA